MRRADEDQELIPAYLQPLFCRGGDDYEKSGNPLFVEPGNKMENLPQIPLQSRESSFVLRFWTNCSVRTTNVDPWRSSAPVMVF